MNSIRSNKRVYCTEWNPIRSLHDANVLAHKRRQDSACLFHSRRTSRVFNRETNKDQEFFSFLFSSSLSVSPRRSSSPGALTKTMLTKVLSHVHPGETLLPNHRRRWPLSLSPFMNLFHRLSRPWLSFDKPGRRSTTTITTTKKANVDCCCCLWSLSNHIAVYNYVLLLSIGFNCQTVYLNKIIIEWSRPSTLDEKQLALCVSWADRLTATFYGFLFRLSFYPREKLDGQQMPLSILCISSKTNHEEDTRGGWGGRDELRVSCFQHHDVETFDMRKWMIPLDGLR